MFQKWTCFLFATGAVLLFSSIGLFAQSSNTGKSVVVEKKQSIVEGFPQGGEEEALEGFEEDGLEGFGEEEEGFGDTGDLSMDDFNIDLGDVSIDMEKFSDFIFSGFFKFDLGYSPRHEEPDFSKIKSTLNLGIEYKFNQDWRFKGNWNGFFDYAYDYRGREGFTEETLDRYESETELRDFYIDGVLTDFLQIKLGRQIIAWGESETAQIVDMANPRDYRELGMVDLEDARLPVRATKISLLLNQMELNLVAIHEIRGNKNPGAGSEFDFLQGFRSSGIQFKNEEIPESTAENSEYLIRLSQNFNGGGFSIVWADTFNDAESFEFYQYARATKTLTLIPRHQRFQTLGFSSNFVSGSWLFKTEFARKRDVPITRNDMKSQLQASLSTASSSTTGVYSEETALLQGWSPKNTRQGMLGVEYSGITDLTIVVDSVVQRIEDYEENLVAAEFGVTYSLRTTYATLNDALKSTLFWVRFPKNNGNVVRVNVDYELAEALVLSAGGIDYISDDESTTVYPYRNNDRLLLGIKQSF